jgi:hypothetical protein
MLLNVEGVVRQAHPKQEGHSCYGSYARRLSTIDRYVGGNIYIMHSNYITNEVYRCTTTRVAIREGEINISTSHTSI